MKHLIARTLASLMLLIAGLSITAPAQSGPANKLIKAHIPFEFSVGKRTLPAGDYTVTQPTQHVIMLRNSEGEAVAQIVTMGIDSSTARTAATLRFYSSEGRHILMEVWRQDEFSGEGIVQSKQMAALAHGRPETAKETIATAR